MTEKENLCLGDIIYMDKIKYITDYINMPKYFECDVSKIKFEKISESIEKGDTTGYLYSLETGKRVHGFESDKKRFIQKGMESQYLKSKNSNNLHSEIEVTILKISNNNKTLLLAFDNGVCGGFAGTSEDEVEVSIYLCYLICENNKLDAGRSIYVSKKDFHITKSKIYYTYY